jgi:hypothetical protein
MSDLVERLREVAERADANYPAVIEQAAARIAQLEAALAMFVCDCTVSERCPAPDNCRNFKARRMLEERT